MTPLPKRTLTGVLLQAAWLLEYETIRTALHHKRQAKRRKARKVARNSRKINR